MVISYNICVDVISGFRRPFNKAFMLLENYKLVFQTNFKFLNWQTFFWQANQLIWTNFLGCCPSFRKTFNSCVLFLIVRLKIQVSLSFIKICICFRVVLRSIVITLIISITTYLLVNITFLLGLTSQEVATSACIISVTKL